MNTGATLLCCVASASLGAWLNSVVSPTVSPASNPPQPTTSAVAAPEADAQSNLLGMIPEQKRRTVVYIDGVVRQRGSSAGSPVVVGATQRIEIGSAYTKLRINDRWTCEFNGETSTPHDRAAFGGPPVLQGGVPACRSIDGDLIRFNVPCRFEDDRAHHWQGYFGADPKTGQATPVVVTCEKVE